MMLRLYLAAGMPAALMRSISRQIEFDLALAFGIPAREDMQAVLLLERSR